MRKLSKKQKAMISISASVAGVLVFGGLLLYMHLPKMPLKKYTAACLYLAVMDDEIARNELEGNTINGEKIIFPPKRESLQYKYHLFLEMHKKLSTTEMDVETQKFEARLEESKKQYLGQPKQELKSEFGEIES